jgi:carboxypeptidase family protein
MRIDETAYASPLFRCFLAILCIALPSLGQTTFGSITGTVVDPSGALVPQAKVRVTNMGEGTTRDVTTSSAGVFNAPNLSVGIYRVEISAPGFAPYQSSGLILSANQVINVDAHLSVTQTSTTLQVTEAATPISTETTNLSNIKTSKDLEELPLISRHQGDIGIYSYVLSNPGVSSVPGNSNSNVQGLRQITGVLPTVDGIAVMAIAVGDGPVQPSFEGIQEVNVQLADTPAEFATAANITMVTKSGTNEFHGSAFWDYNGGRLNARNFFSTTVPFRVYHNFGASAGGPIRKNKTFFFADYEGSRESSIVTVTGTTPLPAWRTGDFSGSSVKVKDPVTGAFFTGNVIPPSRINPTAQKVQDYFYPLPNFGPPGLQSSNWIGNFPANTGFNHYDSPDARLDQNFGNGDKVFARYSYRNMPFAAHDANLPPVGKRIQTRYGTSAVLSWTHLFSPAVLNEFRAGFTRQQNFFYPELVGSDIIQQLGIQGVTTVGIHNVPAFTITGLTTTSQSVAQALTLDTSFQYTDSLSWTRGGHAMKFGFDAIRDQLGGFSYPNNIYGAYNFTGVYTNVAYGDFLLGIPQSTALTVATPARYLRGTTWSAFAQDQFKVTPSLTVNYGVRWQLSGPYYDRYGTIASFDPAHGAFVVPDNGLKLVNPLYPKSIPIITASAAGFPQGALIGANNRDIYPRAGIAFKPFHDDRTVIRAGYGIYGNLIYGPLSRNLGGGPFSGSATFTNSITNGVPLFSLPNPFLANGTTSTQDAFGINPNLATPYTQQWNFTIERQIGQAGIRLSYVGSRSNKLVYVRNLNEPAPGPQPFSTKRRPYPIFNSVSYYDNGAIQNYHALEAAVAKNYGKNLTFNCGFTWAKDLTDAQDTSNAYGQTIANQFDRRAEYGNNLITPARRFYGYTVYRLPFGSGQRFLDNKSKLLQAAFGGWQMAWHVVVQSGQYFTPSFAGFDPSNTNTLGGRPDVVPGVSTNPAGAQSLTNWFNPAAFKIPGCPDSNPVCTNPANVGRFGNAGIGILRGPMLSDTALALSKYFAIRENVRLQFRANAANVFNHPSFALPGSNISATAAVGRITNSATAIFGTVAPREIDFQLRLEF